VEGKQEGDAKRTSAPALAASWMTPRSSAAGIGPVVGAATLGYFAAGSDATAMTGRAMLDLQPSARKRRAPGGGDPLAASLERREEDEAVAEGSSDPLQSAAAAATWAQPRCGPARSDDCRGADSGGGGSEKGRGRARVPAIQRHRPVRQRSGSARRHSAIGAQ
jgi:hypothetical protein